MGSNDPLTVKDSKRKFLVAVGKDEVKMRCIPITDKKKFLTGYQWYKNEKKVISDRRRRYFIRKYKFLKIQDLTKADSGIFTCIVSSSYGSLNVTFKLTVQDPTPSPNGTIDGSPPRFVNRRAMDAIPRKYKEGEKALLRCDAKGTPIPIVKWYKDNKPYRGHEHLGIDANLDPYNYELKLSGLDKLQKGMYACNISNSHGWKVYTYRLSIEELIRIAPRINTITPNKTVTIGQPAEFMCTCFYKANDKYVIVTWFLQRSRGNRTKQLIDSKYYELIQPIQPVPKYEADELTRFEYMLHLPNVTEDDEGWYTCHAENRIHWTAKKTFLRVIAKVIPSKQVIL
ncbi:hypothetical protein QZH41_000722 [Actinostola sp. cb2023]|nr:hypothetical protein QZH41_000722 [Actinostola sp. cb2023]